MCAGEDDDGGAESGRGSAGMSSLFLVIWADESGRAGLFFSRVTPSSQKYLRNWLACRHTKKRDAVRVLLPPRRSRRSRSLVSV